MLDRLKRGGPVREDLPVTSVQALAHNTDHVYHFPFFMVGSSFVDGFIINGCIIANDWSSDSSVLCSNQPFFNGLC